MMKDIYKCKICGQYTESNMHCGLQAELVLSGSLRERLSKLISFLLRHGPWEAGLVMDAEGWVRIKDLVNGIKTKWRNKHLYEWLKEEHVYAVALLDPKGRFELSNDRIRARYGHSRKLGIRINYPLETSLKILYHGTTADKLARILSEGLKPMNRAFVHLSVSFDDACNVGRRHGRNAIVLVVDANCIRSHGYNTYRASRSVVLSEYVPPTCIVRTVTCG